MKNCSKHGMQETYGKGQCKLCHAECTKKWRAEKKGYGNLREQRRSRKEKECVRCNEIKPIEEFHKTRIGTAESYCKPCTTEYAREYRKKKGGWHGYQKHLPHVKKDRESGKAWARAATSRLGVEVDPQKILDNQGGCCAICGDENMKSTKKNMDHCHKTGKPRGVLCTTCNVLLGYYEKKRELLDKFEQYLEEHS